MEATLSSRNQVIIPQRVREFLHISPGDRVKFFLQPDGLVVILPSSPVARLKGSFPKAKRPISAKQKNAAMDSGRR